MDFAPSRKDTASRFFASTLQNCTNIELFSEDSFLWFCGTLFKRGSKEAFSQYWSSDDR